MGIINLTPDSFHAASRVSSSDAVKRGLAMWEAGGSWVDIGGESTRPNADPVPLEQELQRVIPVIAEMHDSNPNGPISVDTRRPEVAAAALDAGAAMINDVSGLRDPAMFDLVLERGAAVCIMHMQGEPRTMQAEPHYDDCITEVASSLNETAERLVASGHPAELILLDPGIGFGKLLEHNLELLRGVDALRGVHRFPIMFGTSRKSMISQLTGVAGSEDRLAGTLATAAQAQSQGVDMLRVHDIEEHAELSAVLAALSSPRRKR